MRRRQFITLLGGAAAAWPLAARGQQPAKLPTIGYLGTAAASAWAPWTAAFVQRLHELGWIDGRTVVIQYRWAEGRTERSAELAAELARLKVDVIVTGGNAALAAKQASSVVPIVFAVVDDPVGMGLVASLARPGGNVTGLSIQSGNLAGKRIELLREVVPGLHRLAIMANVGISFRRAGNARGSERGGHVGPRFGRGGNPACRGHCARPRVAQGSRRCALRCRRRARDHASGADKHFGPHGATNDDAQQPAVRRGGRSDVLRTEPTRPVPAHRRIR